MRKTLIVALAISLGVFAFSLGACGSDDDSSSSADAQEVDGEFIAGMVPHHESAIEMAEIAEDRAEHPEVRKLASEIISAQEAEIADLEADHERIFGEPLADADHEMMEMDSGMSTDMDMTSLENADPFDEAFIDMMIPHHQDAIEMARTELADGEDPELHELAQQIIDAQSAEIEEMNTWREEWYGAPSPAGGVPPESESTSEDDSMEGMDH
jgi:uncharacterized protein (DUF305 family)